MRAITSILSSASRSITSKRLLSTVQENTVRIQFVDAAGRRAIVPAFVGQTLLDAAYMNKIEISGACAGGGSPSEIRRTENWVEHIYGEDLGCYWCHVQIPSKYNDILPEIPDSQKRELATQSEYTFNDRTSTLACQITLDKRHDGMVVFVPEPRVDPHV